MSSLSLQITRIDLHHELQLLIRICFLLDYFLLFLNVLVADFEQFLLLTRQTSTYSKSAVETLKEDVKSDKR